MYHVIGCRSIALVHYRSENLHGNLDVDWCVALPRSVVEGVQGIRTLYNMGLKKHFKNSVIFVNLFMFISNTQLDGHKNMHLVLIHLSDDLYNVFL